jgi:predicted phosphodiesterase
MSVSPAPVSPEEYEEACRQLESLLAAEEARRLIECLERIIRYEAARGVPGTEGFAARLAGGAPAARRTALISDIHGNIEGLRVVLADIEREGCDRIVCLGDFVEGGSGDDEVVATLRGLGVRAVRGNHDEYNDVVLARETRDYLAQLPDELVEGDVRFTHISPRRIKRKLNHAVEAWNVFEEGDFRLLFVGHVHVPLLFAATCPSYGEATPVAFEYNRPMPLEPGERYIACVGSVGYGRDRVGKLRYAIHDRQAATLEFRAIEGPLLRFDETLAGPSGAQLPA